MKAVIINGSPNLDKGNTSLIANPFINALRALGVEVNIFYAYKMNINNCLGCNYCSFNNKGECVQKDDMKELFFKFCEADIKVFVFPVYFRIFPGVIKTILDRFYPIFEPYLDDINGINKHPIRDTFKPGKVVLISSCGYWDKHNFDLILKCFDDYSKYIGIKLAGNLLRPHALLMGDDLDNQKNKEVINASREAAFELINKGKISKITQKKISQELISKKEYIKKFNNYFKL